jgi:hypothetical protein
MFPIKDRDQPAAPASPKDRRRAGRVRCSGTKCQFGPVSDFSRTGIKVLTKKPIKVPEGKTVNLTIEVAGAKLVVPGRVINNRRRTDGVYETAFEFWGIDERWNAALATMGRIASTDCEHIHKVKFA